MYMSPVVRDLSSLSLPPRYSEVKTPAVTYLNDIAKQLRITVLEMIAHANYGHTASALGLADFFAAMYFNVMRHAPHNPIWNERDRLVVSCGHISAIVYAAMATAGYFSADMLKEYATLNSPLQGHPHKHDLPGIECTSGSLGQGVSMAVGMALAARQRKQDHMVYLLTSDGEQQEGQVWEAYMTIARYRLNNLIVFVDRNGIQNSAMTEDIMPGENLKAKLEAFNFNVPVIDGHDIAAIIRTVTQAKRQARPTVIILDTTPGKGVDFMENDFFWHGEAPDKQQLAEALRQINSVQNG